MPTSAEKVHLRKACKMLRDKGVETRTLRSLIRQGHLSGFKPSHWRVLGAVITRNPSVLKLPPKLVVFRVMHNADALETPEHQQRKEAVRARSAYRPPIGLKCPSCGDMTLFVTFPRRSTGPGAKSEETRMARCSHCGLLNS